VEVPRTPEASSLARVKVENRKRPQANVMKIVVNFMTVFLIESILCSRKGKENLSDERPSDKNEKEDYQSCDS
jgi:hypothetical protein